MTIITTTLLWSITTTIITTIPWFTRFTRSNTTPKTASRRGGRLTLAAGDFVAEIDAHPDIDAIDSDEDKLSENGVRNSPYFKPDLDPELLLSQNRAADKRAAPGGASVQGAAVTSGAEWANKIIEVE